jgi:ABC-2 type transport system permease protein
METLRRQLVGGEIGATGVIAVAWCVAITVVGYLWSRRLYDRDPAR